MGVAENPDGLGVFVRTQEAAAIGFTVLSGPGIARWLVVGGNFGLISQHKVAVVKQPRPMFLATGKFALLDDLIALIEQLVTDHVTRSDIWGKKRVSLIHIEGIEIPLHWRMLGD